MSRKPLPYTTAHVRITHHSWHSGKMIGDIQAGVYQWQFEWHFIQGKLSVQPSLGRALIQEPLGRFLERYDYQLEAGGDYEFTVRAEF